MRAADDQGLPGDATNGASGGERRQAARQAGGPGTKAFLLRGQPQQAVPAEVTDLSADGVGLKVAQPVEVGSMVLLDLCDPARQFRVQVLGRVIYAAPTAEGGYRVGCVFPHRLSPAQVGELL